MGIWGHLEMSDSKGWLRKWDFFKSKNTKSVEK